MIKMTESKCEREGGPGVGRDRMERDLPAYSNRCVHLKTCWPRCMERNGYTNHKILYGSKGNMKSRV